MLSQNWAEHKRRVLVITPSNLRKQWFQELTETFFALPWNPQRLEQHIGRCPST